MKIFIVTIYDSTDPFRETYDRIGSFSSKELAVKSGEHAVKIENTTEDGIVHDCYKFLIKEDVVDEYYIKNLTPLAKTMEENDDT